MDILKLANGRLTWELHQVHADLVLWEDGMSTWKVGEDSEEWESDRALIRCHNAWALTGRNGGGATRAVAPARSTREGLGVLDVILRRFKRIKKFKVRKVDVGVRTKCRCPNHLRLRPSALPPTTSLPKHYYQSLFRQHTQLPRSISF